MIKTKIYAKYIKIFWVKLMTEWIRMAIHADNVYFFQTWLDSKHILEQFQMLSWVKTKDRADKSRNGIDPLLKLLSSILCMFIAFSFCAYSRLFHIGTRSKYCMFWQAGRRAEWTLGVQPLVSLLAHSL